MPDSTLKNVVLPEPFGPMMPTISPVVDIEIDGLQRMQAAEILAQARAPRSSGAQ